MADNVTTQSATPATLPANTVISTEEITTLNGAGVSAQQVQRIIPAFRTADGVGVDFPGDAGNGQDVDVTRLPTTATATLANVASSATNVTLLASNASRKQAIIVNDSTQILYVKFGATATSSSFTYKLAAGDQLEFPQPVYSGIVDGIWASANGNARTTEL